MLPVRTGNRDTPPPALWNVRCREQQAPGDSPTAGRQAAIATAPAGLPRHGSSLWPLPVAGRLFTSGSRRAWGARRLLPWPSSLRRTSCRCPVSAAGASHGRSCGQGCGGPRPLTPPRRRWAPSAAQRPPPFPGVRPRPLVVVLGPSQPLPAPSVLRAPVRCVPYAGVRDWTVQPCWRQRQCVAVRCEANGAFPVNK